MLDDRKTCYPIDATFSRQQVQERVGVADDVLAFWIKQGLIVPLPARGRSHRRFQYEQLHIAAILNAMRSLGANISVLRLFAQAFQRGCNVARASGLNYCQLQTGIELFYSLLRFREGKAPTAYDTVKLNNLPIPDFNSDNVATCEEEIEQSWLTWESRDGYVEPAIPFFRSASREDIWCLEFYEEITSPEFIQARHYELDWTWVAWINKDGRPAFRSGENGNVGGPLPTAAFFISISRLIRPLWIAPDTDGGAQ